MNIKNKVNAIRELEVKIRSSSFGDALYYIIDKYEIRVELLSKRACIDKRNIYRYINNEVVPKKDTLVQILIALNVSYRISVELLRSAGYALNSSYQDVFYSVLLENPGSLTIVEANELIAEMNKNEKKNIISEFKIN